VANIPSGPDNNYDILWKVKKYYPILILENTGEWLRFSNYEGDEGWIHRSLVTNISTVITKTTNCNIRKGPSTFYKVSAKFGKRLSFKMIKREGGWLNIQHAVGFIGWIHESLVW
jgi:SH3-like domain-containing protein